MSRRITRFIPRIAAALVTFCIGLALANLLHLRRSEPVPQLTLTYITPSDAFRDTGVMSMFRNHYSRRSDGAWVLYACYEELSKADALESVRNSRPASTVLFRSNVLNENGKKVGERIVWVDSPGSNSDATISWNQGARSFHILARSLEQALAFESSRDWTDQQCNDFKDSSWTGSVPKRGSVGSHVVP